MKTLLRSISIATLAVKVLDHYKSLRRDILLAGVFLHDIGKVRELTYKRTFQYSTAGNLTGHIVLGVVLGVSIPWFTERFRPVRFRLRAWPTLVALALTVLKDIVVSNVQVAMRLRVLFQSR